MYEAYWHNKTSFQSFLSIQEYIVYRIFLILKSTCDVYLYCVSAPLFSRNGVPSKHNITWSNGDFIYLKLVFFL